MRKRRNKKAVEERDILQDLIDAGLGCIPMSKLDALARIFDRVLVMKIVHDGKVLGELKIGE